MRKGHVWYKFIIKLGLKSEAGKFFLYIFAVCFFALIAQKKIYKG